MAGLEVRSGSLQLTVDLRDETTKVAVGGHITYDFKEDSNSSLALSTVDEDAPAPVIITLPKIDLIRLPIYASPAHIHIEEVLLINNSTGESIAITLEPNQGGGSGMAADALRRYTQVQKAEEAARRDPDYTVSLRREQLLQSRLSIRYTLLTTAAVRKTITLGKDKKRVEQVVGCTPTGEHSRIWIPGVLGDDPPSSSTGNSILSVRAFPWDIQYTFIRDSADWQGWTVISGGRPAPQSPSMLDNERMYAFKTGAGNDCEGRHLAFVAGHFDLIRPSPHLNYTPPGYYVACPAGRAAKIPPVQVFMGRLIPFFPGYLNLPATAAGSTSGVATPQPSQSPLPGTIQAPVPMSAAGMAGVINRSPASSPVSTTSAFNLSAIAPYTTIFVRDFPLHPVNAANLSILSTSLLTDGTVTEQVLETRGILARCLASQYFIIRAGAQAGGDLWLQYGMAELTARLALKSIHGTCDYRYTLWRDMQRLCEAYKGHPSTLGLALSSPSWTHSEWESNEWLRLKAALVLATLDHRTNCLQSSLVRTYSLQGRCSSTSTFLKAVKKDSQKDLRLFAEQYIHSNAADLPRITVSFAYSRKRTHVELTIKQGNEDQAGGVKVAGSLGIRIVESDGGRYDHTVHIDDWCKVVELPIHARQRKGRKRAADASSTTAATTTNPAAVEGEEEQEAAEKTAQTIAFIRVDPNGDWLGRVRVEQPDFMWIEQLLQDPEVLSQSISIAALRAHPSASSLAALDRILSASTALPSVRADAAAAMGQCMAAVGGLERLCDVFATKFCHLNRQHPAVVAAAAAANASRAATPPVSHPTGPPPVPPPQVPLSACLVSAETPCKLTAPTLSQALVIRANDFEDLPAYLLLKALLSAIADGITSINSTTSTTTSNNSLVFPATTLLVDVLRYADNSANPHGLSDSYFLATAIRSACHAIPTVFRPESTTMTSHSNNNSEGMREALLKDLLAELNRFVRLERILPAHRNVLMQAVLEGWTTLAQSGCPLSEEMARSIARVMPTMARNPGNYGEVRAAALRCSIIRGGNYAVLDALDLLTTSSRSVESESNSNVDSPLLQDACVDMLWEVVLDPRCLDIADDPEQVRARLSKILEGTTSSIMRRAILQAICPALLGRPAVPVITASTASEVSDAAVDTGNAPAGVVKLTFNLARINTDDVASEGGTTATTQTNAPEDDWLTQLAGPEGMLPVRPSSRPTTSSNIAEVIFAPPKQHQSQSHQQSAPKVDARTAALRSTMASIHGALMANPDSIPFQYAVDPASLPIYYSIIKEPRDLSLILSNIHAGVYDPVGPVLNDEDGDYPSAFVKDLALMLNNCVLFNQPRSLIYDNARALLPVVQRLLKHHFPRHLEAIKRAFKAVTARIAEDMAAPPVPIPGSSMQAPPIVPAAAAPVEPSMKDAGKCRRLLDRIRTHPHAHWFNVPVDPVALGIPTYFDVITSPMDFGTIHDRLHADRPDYTDAAGFMEDVLLVFSNCFAFNPPDTIVYKQGLELLKIVQSWCAKVLPGVASASIRTLLAETRKTQLALNLPTTSDSEMILASEEPDVKPAPSKPAVEIVPDKSELEITLQQARHEFNGPALRILDSLASDHPDLIVPFAEPVDPVALGIPQYSKLVRKPMDFGTMRSLISSHHYIPALSPGTTTNVHKLVGKAVKEFAAHAALVFNNCYKFNGRESAISEYASILERAFTRELSDRFPEYTPKK